jgi:hypothetical protein
MTRARQNKAMDKAMLAETSVCAVWREVGKRYFYRQNLGSLSRRECTQFPPQRASRSASSLHPPSLMDESQIMEP